MKVEISENKSKRLNYTVWVEKFRPFDIASTILPTGHKRLFNKFVKDGEVPNLLLHSSSPGVGKTTVAKSLVNEIDADSIYINTSKENGIDVLRTRIERFATMASFSGSKKIVIMDEFDGATHALQSALRAFIEDFHNSCRFIFICNYITKIIEPLKSRCQVIDFNFMSESIQTQMRPRIQKRLLGILKQEKIEYDSEETITKIVDTYYPDIRKMIQVIQQFSSQQGVINKEIFKYEYVSNDLVTYLTEKNFTKARELVIGMNYNYSELYRFLYDHYIPVIDRKKKAQSIATISEFMWRQSQGVIDPEINFAHCMLELIGV